MAKNLKNYGPRRNRVIGLLDGGYQYPQYQSVLVGRSGRSKNDRSHFKLVLCCFLPNTEVIKIQGVRPRKSLAPPPTAQTPGPNWLIFWQETPHLIPFRGTEAIFEFRIWG